MKNLLILTDSRGYLMTSLLKEQCEKIDVAYLKTLFEDKGFIVEVLMLNQLTFPSKYQDWYVLYPSDEGYGLFYKDYIEDIILKLSLEGAILLPRYEMFRAHHNKVFMELYRKALGEEINNLWSANLYDLKDIEHIDGIKYPIVIKTADGAGSGGVTIAYSEKELKGKIKRLGKIHYRDVFLTYRMKVRHAVSSFYKDIMGVNYLPMTTLRKKIVLQQFVEGLQNDYKVLVFGRKYYMLRRGVRENDFRASGSGKFFFVNDLSDVESCILDFAKKIYEKLQVPMLSVDIAYDGAVCYMIEFQCIHFGPYTIQFSDHYYEKIERKWEKKNGRSIMEVEIANAVDRFIELS